MKSKDEIVEEVRAVREAYAAQFNFDLKRIFADLEEMDVEDSTPHADLKPMKPRREAR